MPQWGSTHRWGDPIEHHPFIKRHSRVVRFVGTLKVPISERRVKAWSIIMQPVGIYHRRLDQQPACVVSMSRESYVGLAVAYMLYRLCRHKSLAKAAMYRGASTDSRVAF